MCFRPSWANFLSSTIKHILQDNYTIAKIRGEKGLLLERQQLNSLAEFRTQSEILGILADGPYGRELSELREGSTPIEVERAVRLSFARAVRNMIASSRGAVRSFLGEFTKRFDAYDLASLIIFKAQGKSWEEFVATRQPLALFKEAELHRIYLLDDARAIVAAAGDRTIEARISDFSMEDISGERAALVRDIITGWGEERFYNYINKELSGLDRQSCLPFVGAVIDLANLAIVLRSKALGNLSVRDHIIPESWKLDRRTMDQLIASQDAPQALELISAHSYYGQILPSARQKYEESKSLAFIEIASRKHSLTLSRRIFAGFPYTLGIVLSYLFLKENESRTLAAIFAGVVAGLKPDGIRSLIVSPD